MAQIEGKATVRILDLDHVKDFVEGITSVVTEYEETSMSPSEAMVAIRKHLKSLRIAVNKQLEAQADDDTKVER